ncbi:MAG: TauD/TfdA family dioxygenase, partial [Pseudomonadota bacterium]|nr:TauD/TfdA family dioxygenase [Pseudomonadota bacterium]
MTLEAIPLSGAMGAEIRGANLRDIDDETFADIHKILLDHGMIFFRDQDITSTQQLIFAKRWGEPHFHPYMPGLPDHPEIIEIVKNPEDTHTFGGQWHTDQMFTPTPAMGTMLYAKEVPVAGGDTLFGNLYLAYDALSDGMKAAIANLRTFNLYDKKKGRSSVMKGKLKEPEKPAEPAIHPLVRPHGETDKPALYICYDRITRHIVDWTPEESRPLLDYLRAHATRPEFTCRLRWEPGTLAFWDNRCVQHMALNDYHGSRRVMHRITIRGERT